jgi:hypothetical protein
VEDVCLATVDEASRQRCMQITRAASACAYSSLLDITSAAALTPDLFSMQSLRAVNAVLSALCKAAFVGLDLPSLKAASYHFLTYRAAGFDAQSLKDEGFTLKQLKDAGCDYASALKISQSSNDLLQLIKEFGYQPRGSIRVWRQHVATEGICKLRACCQLQVIELTLLPTSPKKKSGDKSYFVVATLHCHKVKSDIIAHDGDKPVHMPPGWKIANHYQVRWDIAHNPWQSESLACRADGGHSPIGRPIPGPVHTYGTSMCHVVDLRGSAVVEIKKNQILTSP